MRKRIISLILVTMMLFSAGGCGETSDESANTGNSKKSRGFLEKIGRSFSGEDEETTDTSIDKPDEDNKTETATEKNTDNSIDEKNDNSADDTKKAAGAAPEYGPAIYSKSHYEFVEAPDSYNQLYSLEYDELLLSNDTVDYYPGIKKALDSYNSKHFDVDPEFNFESMKESVLEIYKEDPDMLKQYDKSDADITRLDDKILSITVSFESFYGGAHGMYGNYGYTYDVQTGKELKLTDVVSSMDDLKAAAKEIFSRDYPMIIEEDPESETYLDQAFDDEETLYWSMGPESLYLYFNPYQLTYYANGEQVIEIKYINYPNLFSKGYGAVEGDWVIPFESGLIDINGDDSQDYVSVVTNFEYDSDNDYSYMVSYDITGGNGYLNVEDYSYGLESYLAKKNGKFYILIETTGDNDWHTITTYELTGEEVIPCDETEGRFSGTDGIYEYGDYYFTSYDSELYNPNYFFVCNRMDLISTYDGTRACRLNDKGQIEPIDSTYTSYQNFAITSKEDLTLDIVDEAGNVTGQDTIPANSTFELVKSDNETYVDAMLKDGRMVRLTLDSRDWPRTINGKDIGDIFDGVVFAG